ncbi:hypothetical protein SUDANB19_06609 [Streptomyces sp. enrichment culture]
MSIAGYGRLTAATSVHARLLDGTGGPADAPAVRVGDNHAPESGQPHTGVRVTTTGARGEPAALHPPPAHHDLCLPQD